MTKTKQPCKCLRLPDEGKTGGYQSTDMEKDSGYKQYYTGQTSPNTADNHGME